MESPKLQTSQWPTSPGTRRCGPVPVGHTHSPFSFHSCCVHAQVLGFVQKLVDLLPNYEMACEHEHSNCVLIANKKVSGCYAMKVLSPLCVVHRRWLVAVEMFVVNFSKKKTWPACELSHKIVVTACITFKFHSLLCYGILVT